jgi:protein-S-isoprenylcysteine O-methyltransferase Ste14
VLVIPGIALLTGWWLLLLTSVVMYVAMVMSVHTEDDFLRQKFGKTYEEYRERVLLKFL